MEARFRTLAADGSPCCVTNDEKYLCPRCRVAVARAAGRYGRAPVDDYLAHRRDVGHAGIAPAVPAQPAAGAPVPTSGGRVDYSAVGSPRAPQAPGVLSEADAFRAQLWGMRRGLRGALSRPVTGAAKADPAIGGWGAVARTTPRLSDNPVGPWVRP